LANVRTDVVFHQTLKFSSWLNLFSVLTFIGFVSYEMQFSTVDLVFAFTEIRTMCVLLLKLPLTLKTSIYSLLRACCKFERVCWSVLATSCSVLCLWPTRLLGLFMQPPYLRILYRKKSGGLGSGDHGGQGHS